MRTGFAVVYLCLAFSIAGADPINAAIGDESWVVTYGTEPTGDEVRRIQTHLRYVLARLRARPATPQRTAALAALERYIEGGVFPRRTGDTYAGRRPRFVDDRGVHCAVGQLIADSGHPELARAIAAEHEYAYVPDITTPGLREWAAATGFTLDELAMIQPSYGFERVEPCDDDPWAPIAKAEERIVLACAAANAPMSQVRLVVDRRDGQVAVSTPDPQPFAKCVASRAREELAGSEYVRCDARARHTVLDGYAPDAHAEQTLSLMTPQRVLERHVERVKLDDECWPRPGALARRANVVVTAGERGIGAAVTTTPSNADVAACIARDVRAKFAGIPRGAWNLRVVTQRALIPRANPARMRRLVAQQGQLAATDCYPEGPARPRLDVTVTARAGEPGFAITVGGTDEVFARCVTTALDQRLRSALTTGTRFRIDAGVNISANVIVESKAERVRRFRKLRDEAVRRARDLR